MSIDRLRYFAAVVETGNLRKAADLVGISPPSMSKAIAVLEGELDAKLIHPEGRGIGITPRGREIYGLLTPLLEEQRRFYQTLKAGDPRPTRLRLATFEVFSTYFISAFLAARPRTESPRECLLLEMPPGKLESALLAGLVDYGLTYLPSPDPGLEYLEVGSLEMGLFGNRQWQSQPFSEWPFAVPTTELRIHSSEIDALDLWPRTAPARNIRYRFEMLETALQTSRKGLSVLHCPELIVRLHNEDVKPALQLVPLTPPTGYRKPKPAKIYLVAKKGVDAHELERKLAKFVRLNR